MKFIKLLFSGFETRLNLPARFCGEARDDFARKAVVRTCLGKWKVKVGNEKEIFYLYGKEWGRFVNRHELEEGIVLAFEHHGSFHFYASIFDASACEKLAFPPNFEFTTTATATASARNRTFTCTLNTASGYDPSKKNYCSCLYIPTYIWRSNNLVEKRDVIFKVSGVERKTWRAKLSFYPGEHAANGQDRMVVVGGWSEFASDNNLRTGLQCTFQIITDVEDEDEDAIIMLLTKSN